MAPETQIKSMYKDGKHLCGITLANGEQKVLTFSRLDDPELTEWAQEDGLEMVKLKLDGDYCIINLQAASGQWGRTIVWDYVQDRIVHLTNTPFVEDSVIEDGMVKSRYLIAYWGHPADWWRSEAPLELCDVSYEPEVVRNENQSE